MRQISELRDLVRGITDAQKEWTEKEVAEKFISDVTPDELRLLGLVVAESWAWKVRREQQLVVEREARQEAEIKESRQRSEQVKTQSDQRVLSKEEKFRAFFDKPSKEVFYELGFGQRIQRNKFVNWCVRNALDFAEWKNRAYDTFVGNSSNDDDNHSHHVFESYWHSEGPDDYYRMLSLRKVRQLVDDVARETRLEVTQELLGTEFALGDGRRVTWGTATRADHEQRVSMLNNNAAANAEAAARHMQAIDLLERAGVTCLRDAPAELQQV